MPVLGAWCFRYFNFSWYAALLLSVMETVAAHLHNLCRWWHRAPLSSVRLWIWRRALETWVQVFQVSRSSCQPASCPCCGTWPAICSSLLKRYANWVSFDSVNMSHALLCWRNMAVQLHAIVVTYNLSLVSSYVSCGVVTSATGVKRQVKRQC